MWPSSVLLSTRAMSCSALRLSAVALLPLVVCLPRAAHAQDTDPVLGTPAVDQPAPERKPFAFSFGVAAGIDYFTESTPFGTDTGVGLALAPGYNVGLRSSFEFLPWLALDARGMLLHNDGNAYVNYGSLTALGGLGAARFTLPTRHIRPYALVGFGGYHFAASGAGSELVSGTFSAIEFGLGATVPVGHNIEVGVEYLYSHLNSETLSTHTMNGADGGDPSTLSFFVQYRLPL